MSKFLDNLEGAAADCGGPSVEAECRVDAFQTEASWMRNPHGCCIVVPEPEPTHTLVMTLAYNGAGFCGFAKQKDEGVRTVQDELEAALATVFPRKRPPREAVSTVCAGRTDTGVHAFGQVVSCPLFLEEVFTGKCIFRNPTAPETYARVRENMRDMGVLQRSLNALTGHDLVVRECRVLDGAEFSARFDAVEREYRYRIVVGNTPPLFLKDFAAWHRGALDVEAMREAASHLIGEHDFKSFCKAVSAEGKTTMRCVSKIELFEEEHLGERCLVVRVVGNAFLHSMVRTIVGTLLMVGEGLREPAWTREVLAARDRRAAGPNAPAHGLTFWNVTY